jgi:hypothetical protein
LAAIVSSSWQPATTMPVAWMISTKLGAGGEI